MRWAVILSLIVAVGAGASLSTVASAKVDADAAVRQVKQSSADLSRQSAGGEAEAKAAFERGREAHNAGKRDEAVRAFERAVALEPTSSLYHLWLGHAYSRHLARGEAAMRRFLALTGADPVQRSNAHYRLGMMKEKLGDAPAAATEYRAPRALYPRHEPAAAALKKIQP